MTERLEATIHGQVQGVGFRWFVKRHAVGLGLNGWVANEAGDTVRVVAEGPAEALDELVAHLRRGPSGADVSTVDERRSPSATGLDGFEIRARDHAGD